MTDAAPPVIDPQIDVYGKDGRTSALADLIEFRAIKGLRMSAAELADLVVEMNWSSRPTRQIILTESDVDDAPEPLAGPSLRGCSTSVPRSWKTNTRS